MFAVLILLLLGINGLSVVNSYVGRDFMTAIAERHRAEFLRQAFIWMGVFAAATVVAVMARFFEERLGLLWRNWATCQVLERYMAQRVYFRLTATGRIRNPDQRIAEDIRTFTATTLSFVLMILNGTITAVAFSGVLWSISPKLFGVAVLYAGAGSVLTVALGRSLMRLNFYQLDKEANFRAALLHVKENAHLVALARREEYLSRRLLRRLADLTDNFRRIISINRNVGFFTTGYSWMIQLIPALVVAPLFIDRQVEFGVVTQSAVAFTQLVGAFSLIITQFQSISSFAAVIARLDSLIEAMDQDHDTAQQSKIEIAEDGEQVAYENLTLRSPRRRRTLVERLTVTIRGGQRLLVRGTDDTARTALFRATAGIWEFGEGRIVRPPLERILFLSERPYLPRGTLREVLVSQTATTVSDDRIGETLRALGMETLPGRFGGYDTEHDWEGVLALGEQQLLACARLLLAAPRFAFLERPGTALEPAQLDLVLRMLAATATAYVVFEQYDGDLRPYEAVLELAPGGSWTLRTVTDGTDEG